MNYKWYLKDLDKIEKNGLKVFSCFACGGGSSMGYKLAGYEVLGCNEIDPKMMEVYKTNFNPKYSYLEGIQTFKDRKDLPKELYDLDILDGSPPCSNFSMAGNREKDWGKKKKFREGQAEQVLDTLFFDFIDLAKKLQPKVIIAENVKGILLGEAIKYVQKIIKGFEEAGYYTHHWLLDASKMGVPQRRQRVFFISIRKDIANKIPRSKQTLLSKMPYLNLWFEEKEITLKDFKTNNNDYPITEHKKKIWNKRKFGDIDFSYTVGRNYMFNIKYLYMNRAVNTLTGKKNNVLFDEPRHLNDEETCMAGSMPLDYNVCKSNIVYLSGMSVPPLMIAKIAKRIKEQWFDKARIEIKVHREAFKCDKKLEELSDSIIYKK